MSYREWITATLAPLNIGGEAIDLILTNQSLAIPDGDAEVNVRTAKMAICNELANILPLQSSVSQGGYSVSWNWEAVKTWYEIQCEQLGIRAVTKPQVRNRSNVW